MSNAPRSRPSPSPKPERYACEDERIRHWIDLLARLIARYAHRSPSPRPSPPERRGQKTPRQSFE